MWDYLPELPWIQLIRFGKPELLWLLAALPILWLRFRSQRLVTILGRSLIAGLLIVALADPQAVTEQTAYEERLFAFDLSRSIPPDMRRWMEQSAQGDLAPADTDRVFLFGAEAVQTAQWREALKSDEPAAIEPGKTSLERLLSTVLALPPRPRSLFLFTDGWETEGNVTRLLPLISGSGLKIFPILPAEAPRIANVAVTKLLAPSHGNSAESINLKAALENYGEREVDGTLVVERNGEALKTERLKLKPGSHLFTYETTLPETPVASYRATFTPSRPDLDNYTLDNHALASVSVRTKAKILLLNGRSGAGRYMEEILKRQGFEVTSRTVDAAPPPSGYGIVVFNNVERDRLPGSYLSSVERHVAAGHGFLMLGNEASFAPNAYRGTPIENLLPVEPKEPPKREEKNRAVILVIDKSGSMREDNRILYAQEAAKGVVRQLNDNDFIGVVGFDVSPFVITPLARVSTVRRSFESDIERLKASGRTYLLPAINEAKRQLQRQDASAKHIIILSDGETGGSGGDYIDLVHVMRTELKITVSAVAIGAEANLPLMKRITQYGGGFFHHIHDPRSLPRIVLQQIQETPQNETPKERELIPVQEPRSELLASLAQRNYPRVLGYMETEIKRGADVDVSVPREERRAPLVASWRYGRGKSVALTMDMEGKFSRHWIQWNGLQGFWEKAFDWLRPPLEAVPLHEARVSLVNLRPVLDLFIYEDASTDSQFSFEVSGKSGQDKGTLKRVAPGHFQTQLPLTRPGEYKIELTELRRDRRLALSSLVYSLPYDADAEIPRISPNTALLAQLAQASGGEINPHGRDIAAEPTVLHRMEPKREPLIVMAFLLFLIEVALRKFVLAEAD
ncbi:MAG TPA: VWA domain-containing protein [Candidatus Binatia bacterium]|nr:VWA domain-containing protein [Candidatus Binatia bacterium]